MEGGEGGAHVSGNFWAIMPASSCAFPAGGQSLKPTMQIRVLPEGTARQGGGLGFESPPPITIWPTENLVKFRGRLYLKCWISRRRLMRNSRSHCHVALGRYCAPERRS